MLYNTKNISFVWKESKFLTDIFFEVESLDHSKKMYCPIKRYFIIDEQIARHFVQNSESLSTPPSF